LAFRNIPARPDSQKKDSRSEKGISVQKWPLRLEMVHFSNFGSFLLEIIFRFKSFFYGSESFWHSDILRPGRTRKKDSQPKKSFERKILFERERFWLEKEKKKVDFRTRCIR